MKLTFKTRRQLGLSPCVELFQKLKQADTDQIQEIRQTPDASDAER